MRNEDPLITVIIPIYNIMDCLERCVSSVCAQTYRNLEILLVDDGSTDGTGALCDRLAERDGRIRVFHKENGGSSSARNLGLQKARGEYLGFVDSDDFIEPDMYGRLMEQVKVGGYSIVQASRDEIDENGQKRADVCTPPEKVTFLSGEAFLRELLLHRGDCSFCTKLTARRTRIFTCWWSFCRRRRAFVSFLSSFIMYITAWAAIPGGRSGMIFPGFLWIL